MIKKIAFLFLMSLITFSFVSCSEKKRVEENPINDNNIMNVEITTSNTILNQSSVEETVNKIYDSVVAINAYVNGEVYSRGSGVLIGKSETHSFVVTCHHVIADCQNFDVILKNNEVIEAKLVGGDEKSDIALLAINKIGLDYAVWYEDTDKLNLGSTVICIGNPLGTLPGSVSTGVISYNNRPIKVDNYNTRNLIQTDVAINSGNSGGGLFNALGALIGIVNAKYSSSGIEGLGFAIPAKEAKNIVEKLLKTASYNTEMKAWTPGYVEGRWSLDFVLGYGGYGFVRTSIGIAQAAKNKSASDYNLLLQNDLITGIKIHFKDESKTDLEMKNISAQTATVDSVYDFIYKAGMQIGDTLKFTIVRNEQTLDVVVELIQYRYEIL